MACGYCTDPDHRKPDCKVFHDLRLSVWNGTIDGRKRVHALATATGLGPGSLFKALQYGDIKNFMMLGTTPYDIKGWGFFKFKNVRYSKQTTVYSLFHSESYESYGFKVLDIAKGQETYFNAAAVALYEPKRWTHDKLRWGGFTVLEPSHDEFDYDEAVISEEVRITPRLAVSRELAVNKNYPNIIKGELVSL